MLMQDLLHHWWMGYLKNFCHAQARPHQAEQARESTGCMEGGTDCLASSVADFLKNLFVGKFRLRCDKEPSIMAVAEKSESENARLGSGGNLSATQLSEQRPRRTITSDNWRTNEDSSIRHAESLQDANHAGIGNLAMDGWRIRTWSGWHHIVQSSV